MDKKTRNFVERTSDIMPIPEGTFLHREVTNGQDFYTLRIPEGEKMLDFKSWWENPNKPAKKDKSPPKHTGGKKPYVMLMIEEVDRLRKDGVKNVEELTGYLVSLGKYIEWNTGKLIQTRTKKPIKYTDFKTIFRCGNKKLNRLLGEMKEHELLYSTDGGYIISSRIIKKGKMKKEGD